MSAAHATSPDPDGPLRNGEGLRDRLGDALQRARYAFGEFLLVPFLTILAFFAMAAVTSLLDHGSTPGGRAVSAFLERHFFRDARATSDLLATIATGLITLTSITFSILLLAVQQSAGTLTHRVIDQFLRRFLNRFVFGFFVGLSLYSLIILATVDEPYNPVLGATTAVVLTAVALFSLIVLLYATLDQMRPESIVRAIHDHVLAARRHQGALLARTRRTPGLDAPVRARVHLEANGFLTGLDAEAIGRAIEGAGAGAVEVHLTKPVGGYVAFGDEVALIRASRDGDLSGLAAAIRGALVLQRQRDLDRDPAYGIEQLVTIGWTSISTAKQNLAPGLLVVRTLRDLLARLAASESRGAPDRGERLPIVYEDDLIAETFEAMASMIVATSESMQGLTLVEAVRSLALLFGRMPGPWRERAWAVARCVAPGLADHVPTPKLDRALGELAASLAGAGWEEAASEIEAVREKHASLAGRFSSRGARATQAG